MAIRICQKVELVYTKTQPHRKEYFKGSIRIPPPIQEEAEICRVGRTAAEADEKVQKVIEDNCKEESIPGEKSVISCKAVDEFISKPVSVCQDVHMGLLRSTPYEKPTKVESVDRTICREGKDEVEAKKNLQEVIDGNCKKESTPKETVVRCEAFGPVTTPSESPPKTPPKKPVTTPSKTPPKPVNLSSEEPLPEVVVPGFSCNMSGGPSIDLVKLFKDLWNSL